MTGITPFLVIAEMNMEKAVVKSKVGITQKVIYLKNAK
jgi:hypothetical protein